MDILKLAAEFAAEGLDFNMPRLTDWAITSYGTTVLSVDVADIASGGAAYVVPANVNVGAGTTELELHKPSANLSFKITGWGGKLGVAAGWNLIPGVKGDSSTLLKAGEKVLKNSQGLGGGALSGFAKLPNGGIGTLMAGPKAPAVLAPKELEGFLTIVSSEANFGTNGVGVGIAIFANQPIITPAQLVFARAIGIVADVHFTLGTVDAGVNYAVFKCSVDMKSLAQPGAYHGMSVAT